MKFAVKTSRGYTSRSFFRVAAFTFTCAFGLLYASVPAGAEVLPKTAKLLPPETVAMVDIENFGQLKQQFEKTNLYKLYKEPAMSAFINNAKKKWQEKIKETNDEIIRAIIDSNMVPSGRLAVALVLNGQIKETNEPPILFISQWGENAQKIKDAVEKMVKKASEEGINQRSEDYRGVGIKTMLKENTPQISYCFIDDCLIGSTNADVLKFVVAHIKGADSPTLANDSDYTAAIAATGPYHDIDFYVNIKQIIKTVTAEEASGEAKTTMTNLGLDNVSGVGGSVGVGRGPGSSNCGKAILKINGDKKGICRILDVESAVIKAPLFAPASVYSAMFLNLDIKKAYGELYNTLNNFSPTQAAMMNTPILPAGPNGEPGVELKSGIIDHLGSQVVIAQNINKPFSKTSSPADSLIALAVSDRIALEKSLSLIHSKIIAPNNPDARRELLGHTIYLMKSPALPFFGQGATPMDAPPAGATAPPMPTFAFTLTDTYLILGVESSVEQAIRTLNSGASASVGSAKWFTSARSAIEPSSVGLASMEDNAASSELLWWMLKETGKINTANTPMSPNSGMMFSQMGFDFSLLPEFDSVRKYFGVSVFYGVSRPDGFFFEFKDINAGGL